MSAEVYGERGADASRDARLRAGFADADGPAPKRGTMPIGRVVAYED